jgi:hypothetical protein
LLAPVQSSSVQKYMHSLFEKASELTESIIAAAIEVPFFVELRAGGSFTGTASFDLPQLPGALLMKIGAPVVSSQNFEGRSWFVQTHEFALFSQKPGTLEVPAFKVRFASREGFTGPAADIEAQSPGWRATSATAPMKMCTKEKCCCTGFPKKLKPIRAYNIRAARKASMSMRWTTPISASACRPSSDLLLFHPDKH